MCASIRYNTYLDYYGEVGVIMLMLLILENFFVSSVWFPEEDDEVPLKIDMYFAWLFNILWYT